MRDLEKTRAAARAWRAANLEKKRASDRTWRAANLEKHRAASKKWSANHREHRRKLKKAWARAHPEQYRAINRAKRARQRARQREARLTEAMQQRGLDPACAVCRAWAALSQAPFTCPLCHPLPRPTAPALVMLDGVLVASG